MRLYKHSQIKTKSISKRRKKYIANNIDSIMNNCFCIISKIPETKLYTKEQRYRFTIDAIEYLLSLQPHLLSLWNITHDEIKSMVYWVNLINECIELLNMKLSEEDKRERRIFILDRRFIRASKFMDNLSKLHEYTHDKVIKGAAIYDDTYGVEMIRLVGGALYHMSEANKKVPETKDEYKIRTKHIDDAISSLKRFERMLIDYIFVNNFSNNEIQEWFNLYINVLKLIYGLRRSDKERFSNLP